MNILFNCTTNIVGGGLKNSAFFIKKAIDDKSVNWHFAVCRPVYSLLLEWELELDSKKFTIFENSPSKNLGSRKVLKDLSKKINIDLVYTMAGPAYVKFNCKHLLGISNPYITHADLETFRLRGNLLKTLKFYGHVAFQFINTYKASYYVFQTENARKSFHSRSKIKNNRLFVIPNAFDMGLRTFFDQKENITQSKKEVEIKILTPGAGYIHKGFQFVPKIAFELKNISQKRFKFILTLPFDSPLWLQIEEEAKNLGVSDFIFNFGPYKYTDLKNLLLESNIVFVPSLLETFSASYLEAMCARRKLVVADKSFSREVCEDYATYINPIDAKNTARTFSKIITDYSLTKEEIEKADKILNNYGDQDQRFEKIVGLIKKLTTK